MNTTLPLTRDLVFVGGGHTHALVLRSWGMNPLPGVRVTVINPGPTAPYSGMLPGFVAGHYTREELDIDLIKLARFAGARIINGAVTAIDPKAKLITVPGRPPIAYDVAAIDVGITSEMPKMLGFAEFGVPAKPLGVFADKWNAFRETAVDPTLAVIGGGVAGSELAMAMSHALRNNGQNPTIHLIDRSKVLSVLGYTARQKMNAALTANNITIHENAPVAALSADGVVLEDGTTIPSDFTVGAAGAKPHDWLSDIGIQMHDGFIWTDETLRSSDPDLFAVGDCGHFSADPRPKAGVYAVRQAPVLFDNLRAALSGGAFRPYRPQKDYLKLISLGEQKALAEKFGTARSGRLLWKWKDQIDRKFMNQFADLDMMEQPSVPLTTAVGVEEALGDKPLCGGCGAKVGRSALQSALRALPPSTRDDIEVPQGDDAGILRFGKTRQVISTDHLRSLMHDPVLMTKIAATHALGDVWAMGAKPQAVTINVILPRLSTALQKRTLQEILTTAHQVVSATGAAIVGGHTSVGDELTLGFTVTGLCEKPITLGSAKAGDALILTKPVGSGVLMAAEMAGQAPGADVVKAWGQMAQGQQRASEILAGARAMTDVTGFGLAGHLDGICDASGVGAEVTLSAVPIMEGAFTRAKAGTTSSLFAENVSAVGGLTGQSGALRDLMFDPQTAGGLLAAVPATAADTLISELHAAGYEQANVIGKILAGSGIKLT